ncbi:catalase family peroxidase [Methylobacterium sp. 17Sr1-1]|uniref:catalase family peroxidase n=1 Tax=Methylobacterium sp. 17Sr1-1 TaxID=2202826 RepID=UPI000D70438D|nr:catalase family peroxidase [Methylobacterium sp. 17Sr1-1]AWN51058.1 catalase [Methylobacterium sp. 17Sr1-1]
MAHFDLADPGPLGVPLTPSAATNADAPGAGATLHRAIAMPLLGAALLSTLVLPTVAIAADAQGLVDALKIVAGKPPGVRATFAKGQCVRGTYTPSADVGAVTRSISFTRPWPLIGRFSVGGGNPTVPDTARTVLRGFSIKILSGGDETHLLFENAPVHFARTLDQMLGFLQVRAPGADGKPNQEAIAAFAKANPETTRQAAFVAGRPLPRSYAGVTYWGVHTFTGVNAAGQAVPFKFRIVPEAGEIALSDEEAKGKPPQFLNAELADRLSRGAVRFDVMALLSEAGDDLAADITLRWKNEDDRKAVKLGTIAVTALEPNETCNAGIFDPGQLADGIEAPKDEIFTARRTAYGISFGLRAK